MCTSKLQQQQQQKSTRRGISANRIPLLERHNSFPASSPKSPTSPLPANKKSKHDKSTIKATTTCKAAVEQRPASRRSFSVTMEAPGTIAAARREQVTIMQEQRKMRIAHYGRKNASKLKNHQDHHSDSSNANVVQSSEKRCSFITPNSDPIYVAYHDNEWGVAVHDDKLLFELLVLTGAQVGSDWTSVLRKTQDLRIAFSGFDAEIVSKFTEKKIVSISSDYGVELSQVRGVVDNSKSILEMKKQFGSFDSYLWGFVNNKPIETGYKRSHKIPAKTSKSESISKDMVKRGFRLVGPTVMHSFMQAAGLTNDHLLTCPQHSHCSSSSRLVPENASLLQSLITATE